MPGFWWKPVANTTHACFGTWMTQKTGDGILEEYSEAYSENGLEDHSEEHLEEHLEEHSEEHSETHSE